MQKLSFPRNRRRQWDDIHDLTCKTYKLNRATVRRFAQFCRVNDRPQSTTLERLMVLYCEGFFGRDQYGRPLP